MMKHCLKLPRPVQLRDQGHISITPPVWRMTFFTLCAIPTVMFISMTINTTGRQALIHAVPVAGIAGNVAMLANQRERCSVVIEIYIAPATGGMAGTAVRTKLPAVVIILCVASITV